MVLEGHEDRKGDALALSVAYGVLRMRRQHHNILLILFSVLGE